MNCPKCRRPLPEPIPGCCPFCQEVLHSPVSQNQQGRTEPVITEKPRSDQARIILLSVFAVLLAGSLILAGILVFSSLRNGSGNREDRSASAKDVKKDTGTPTGGTQPTTTEPEPPTTEPEPPTTDPEPTESQTSQTESLRLSLEDMTFFAAGECFQQSFVGTAPASVAWTSLNPAVASVDTSGLITAVGPGTTRIIAASGEQQVECWVRCKFSAEPELTQEEKIEKIREEYNAFQARMSELTTVYSGGYTCYVLDGMLAAAQLTYDYYGEEVTEHYYYENGEIYFILISWHRLNPEQEYVLRQYIWEQEIIRWTDSEGTIQDDGNCFFRDALQRGMDCYRITNAY